MFINAKFHTFTHTGLIQNRLWMKNRLIYDCAIEWQPMNNEFKNVDGNSVFKSVKKMFFFFSTYEVSDLGEDIAWA